MRRANSHRRLVSRLYKAARGEIECDNPVSAEGCTWIKIAVHFWNGAAAPFVLHGRRYRR